MAEDLPGDIFMSPGYTIINREVVDNKLVTTVLFEDGEQGIFEAGPDLVPNPHQIVREFWDREHE
jgi:hypothetical protein